MCFFQTQLQFFSISEFRQKNPGKTVGKTNKLRWTDKIEWLRRICGVCTDFSKVQCPADMSFIFYFRESALQCKNSAVCTKRTQIAQGPLGIINQQRRRSQTVFYKILFLNSRSIWSVENARYKANKKSNYKRCSQLFPHDSMENAEEQQSKTEELEQPGHPEIRPRRLKDKKVAAVKYCGHRG